MKIFQYYFFILLTFPTIAVAQEKFDFFISNYGNDAYSGTSPLLPKRSLAGIAPLLKSFSNSNGIVKLGLKKGDIFDENLATSYSLQLNTFGNNSNPNDFAIFNGSKEFSTGWVKDTGTNNVFKQAIPYTGFTGYGINGIGSYSLIYVIEIDKVLEKTAPFTARRLLKFQPLLSDLEYTSGSFYIPVNTNENPLPVYVHTSEGNSPNENSKFRYEVTVRDWAVNSTYQQNSRFENLWVRGFGAGIGMLPGGNNSYYNKIIFGPGASVHHLVLRSGTIDHSLFLPAPKNTNGYAVVFYDTEGLGRHCSIKNSIFMDIRLPVYAHTSLGTNYGAVEMDNVVGFADSTEKSGFMYTSNNDTVLLNNVYTDGYTAGYFYGNAKYASITNSWFKDVTFGIAYSAKNPVLSSVKNVFIKTRGTDYTSGIAIQDNTTLNLTNSVIHVANSNKNAFRATAGSFIVGGASAESKFTASGNIFICDIDPSQSLNAAITNTDNGIATSKDSWYNNVYILLKGNKIFWTATNASTNGGRTEILNFETWKKQSGQDQNSLFFDLRLDPRGLKAIFVDPENGNYDLANTPEGKRIAALHAGMLTPINCFLQKPTYEEAAEIIRNNKVLSVNACRNPCQQNNIRVNSALDVAAINNRQIKLQWIIPEQQNIDHYEIHRSTESSFFNRVISIAVTTDSLYSFINDVEPGISYRYRLVIVARSGNKCYSESGILKINQYRDISIYPNPSTGKILVSLNGYIGHANFIVSNSIGQIILKKNIPGQFRAHELDLTNISRGVYFLKVENSKGIFIQKFTLQ